jgi:ribosomal protein L7Ae-like RNA K-turn-binding protein
VIYGGDNIVKVRSIKLVMCARDINRTAHKDIENYCSRESIPILYCDSEEMKEFTSRNIKALGITDCNLADAIRENYRVGADE